MGIGPELRVTGSASGTTIMSSSAPLLNPRTQTQRHKRKKDRSNRTLTICLSAFLCTFIFLYLVGLLLFLPWSSSSATESDASSRSRMSTAMKFDKDHVKSLVKNAFKKKKSKAEQVFEEALQQFQVNRDTMPKAFHHPAKHALIDIPKNKKKIRVGRDQKQKDLETGGEPHLYPRTPYLPIFPKIKNAETLIAGVLNGKPTIAGISALLQKYMAELHDENMRLSDKHAEASEITASFYDLVHKHLAHFDAVYSGKAIFPIRKDESIFLSLAAFREHLLADTMQYAFDNAKYPDKLFVGAVVQNCFGKVLPDGSVDPSGKPCRTGVEVVGKNKNGRDMTKVSDAPVDKNGIEDFCTNPKYKKYCESGQVRVVYVHETESLGPAMARYHASKLWGGEAYFVQTDSHLQFAVEWDEKYRDELKATRNFPKSVLSSYPPGFQPGAGRTVDESNGARLCYCETRVEDPNPIVRINTGQSYRGDEPRPTQIPFIAAGFFFTTAEFLVDVPFDPFMPWCFMGEEIALSSRAWTHGWDIYAPRKNLIAHQYRPGRMGLPKFWESVGRRYGKPGLNTKLQGSVIMRVKHLVGYPDASLEKLKQLDIEFVLEKIEEYGMGDERKYNPDYMEFAGMSVDNEHDALQCHAISWCNQGRKE